MVDLLNDDAVIEAAIALRRSGPHLAIAMPATCRKRVWVDPFIGRETPPHEKRFSRAYVERLSSPVAEITRKDDP